MNFENKIKTNKNVTQSYLLSLNVPAGQFINGGTLSIGTFYSNILLYNVSFYTYCIDSITSAASINYVNTIILKLSSGAVQMGNSVPAVDNYKSNNIYMVNNYGHQSSQNLNILFKPGDDFSIYNEISFSSAPANAVTCNSYLIFNYKYI